MADPGFSPGGGANSQKCSYFLIFCRKLHENERIWTPRGGRASLAPPLGSANGYTRGGSIPTPDLYPTPGWVLTSSSGHKRTVCILLECFLVQYDSYYVLNKMSKMSNTMLDHNYRLIPVGILEKIVARTCRYYLFRHFLEGITGVFLNGTNIQWIQGI